MQDDAASGRVYRDVNGLQEQSKVDATEENTIYAIAESMADGGAELLRRKSKFADGAGSAMERDGYLTLIGRAAHGAKRRLRVCTI